MAKIYFRKIKAGSMSIEDVPLRWREATQALLDEDEAARAAEAAKAAQEAQEAAAETPVATTTSILDGMTVAQLKEYAANNNIDITGLTLKADIRAAIEAAEAQNGEG